MSSKRRSNNNKNGSVHSTVRSHSQNVTDADDQQSSKICDRTSSPTVTETTLSSTQIEREEDELDCIDADPLEIRPEADERDLDVCAKEPNVTTLKSNIHSKGTASIGSAPDKVEVVKKRSSEIDLSHDNPKVLKMAVEKSRAELDLVGLVIFIGEKRVMGPVVAKAKASPSNLVNTTQQLIVVDANRRQFQVINRGREACQLPSTSSGAKRSISFSSSPSSTSINSSTSPASDIDSLLFSDVRVNCVYKFIGLLNGIYRESTAVNSISYRVSKDMTCLIKDHKHPKTRITEINQPVPIWVADIDGPSLMDSLFRVNIGDLKRRKPADDEKVNIQGMVINCFRIASPAATKRPALKFDVIDYSFAAVTVICWDDVTKIRSGQSVTLLGLTKSEPYPKPKTDVFELKMNSYTTCSTDANLVSDTRLPSLNTSLSSSSSPSVSSSSSVGAIPDLIEVHISKPWCKDINDLVSDAKKNGEAFISRHPFWVTQIGRGKARLQAEDTDPAEEYVWHQCVNVGCSKFTTKVTMGEKCKWRCSKGHVNPKAKPTFFFSVSLRSNNVDEYLLDNVIVSDEQAQLFLQTTAEKFDKIEEESEEFENVLSRVKDVIFRCSIRAAVNDLNPRFVNFKIETVERN